MTLPLAGAAQGSDSLRAVLDSVFAKPEYRWEYAIRTEGPLARLWRQTLNWLGNLQQSNPAAFRALFWVLVAALALILAHAAFTAWRTMRWATGPSSESADARLQLRDSAWFAEETRRLAQAGRYAEAMQTDFIRLILELDARRLIRFHPSKTPGEFAREVPAGPARERMQALVVTLYRYAFAREPCGPAEFASWRSASDTDRYAPAS